MKNFKTIILLTLAVTFLASDFVQAQWWRRSRPQRTTSQTQPVSPQTAKPQTTSQPAVSRPVNDGWSAWKPMDRRAYAVIEKAGLMPGIGAKMLKYRVKDNRYQIQMRSYEYDNNGNRGRAFTDVLNFVVNPDGSVDMP